MAHGGTRPGAGLRFYLVEGLTVVLSILLAFSLDAWWSGRELRSEVVEDLLSIDQELEGNAERVRYQLDLMSRIVSAGDVLLADMDARPGSRTLPVPDTIAWFVLLGISPTFDASLGGIEALIASGRLSAVRSRELRTRLAGLAGEILDAVEEQYINRDLEYDRMQPILAPVFDRAPLFRVAPDFFDERVPGRPVQGTGTIRVPNSLELRNVIRSRNGNMGTALVEMRGLLQSLGEIHELIATEVR
ncbi:MAG: hypothetical protein PVH00_12335 [Gemmatimonadota bacterium]|jgi:hypothetical protein